MNFRESTAVQEWQAEARVEAQQDFLLRALRRRFQTAVPENIKAAIEGLNDSVELTHWFEEAITARSLEAFRTTFLLGCEIKARVKTNQQCIVRALEVRFPKAVSPELKAQIEALTDFKELDRLFDVAVTAGSVEAFHVAMQSPPNHS